MTKLTVVLAVLPLLPWTAGPSSAASIEDTVRSNCTREISSSTDVSRNQIKTFRLIKTGDGFEMSGFNEENQTVTCKAAPDGHVTWVTVR